MGPYRQALAPTCRGGVETNMNSKRKKPGDEHAGQEQAVAQEMDKVTEERMAELLGITLRALNAIRQAQRLADLRRMASKSAYPTSPFVFQPSKGGLWINEPSVTIRHFKSALKALDIRERRQYDTRHTYATMCLMAGMNRSVHREPARP